MGAPALRAGTCRGAGSHAPTGATTASCSTVPGWAQGRETPSEDFSTDQRWIIRRPEATLPWAEHPLVPAGPRCWPCCAHGTTASPVPKATQAAPAPTAVSQGTQGDMCPPAHRAGV